jgi:DNA invertase Pin-like site-specific DNA recombinase
MEKKFVSYLRVSTTKQGASGLGLEAQRAMCADFANRNNGVVVKEFVDVESGTHRDRQGLFDAIAYCKNNNMPLVIAKLDRLARDVEFTFKVINTGIEIHFTDMPMINTMILGVFASVAQYERELISARTKAALNAKKAKGEKLGRAIDGWTISDENESARIEKAANTKRSRFQANKENVALMKIMRNVFPECASHNENEWQESFVNTKFQTRDVIIKMMRDYKDIDSTLFNKWDLDTNDTKFQQKLAGKMQRIIKSLNA